MHLLPFLDQGQLYRQFKLDEPWDSPHNKKLIEHMPVVFKNPNLSLPDFKTNYLVPIGKGTIFEGTKEIGMSRITDGTSNTVMVVEANADQAVIWTKPDDLAYDPANPLRGLGGLRPGGFQVGFADGSVHFISSSVDLTTLRALFTYAGGESVLFPN